jgi:hypothetical protein
MNSHLDLRWLLFATVPVNGYINSATPIARGIVWLWRRATRSGQRRHPEVTQSCGESPVTPTTLVDQPVP